MAFPPLSNLKGELGGGGASIKIEIKIYKLINILTQNKESKIDIF